MAQAFRRNTRVTIQRATATADSLGGQALTWATLAQEYAAVIPTQGMTGEQGAQVTERMPWSITMPYRSGVRVRDRITDGTRTFEVFGVADPDGRRREMVLTCGEVQS